MLKKIKESTNERIRKTIFELFTGFAKLYGYPKSIGEVYALLYLHEKPLSMDEIMEELKMSKGNVSMCLRKLEEMGFVKRVWISGRRRDYFTINKRFSSFREIIKKKYELLESACSSLEGTGFKKLPQLKRMKKICKKIIEALEKIEGEEN